MYLKSLIALLLVASFAIAQPPSVPKVPVDSVPPKVPQVKKAPVRDVEADLQRLLSASSEANMPVVLFVGVYPARVVKGTTSMYLASRKGYPSTCVAVCMPDGKGGMFTRDELILAANATDQQIRTAAGLERAALPAPFALPNAGRDDSGPWLPLAEQARLKALWPHSTPFPQGLRFYKRSVYSQYLAGVAQRGGGYNTIEPIREDRDYQFSGQSPALNPNRIGKWLAPGGLDTVPRSQWTSYIGAVIDDARPIHFWEGAIATSNGIGGNLHKKLWQFSHDTTFVDMLTDADDKPFLIRRRDKIVANGKQSWDSYAPFRDRSRFPAGYVNIGNRQCASCHENADGPEGEVYFINVRGGDGTRSFPVMKEGTIRPDKSLPLVEH